MMKIGRNMIVAIMITFCFTASLFLVIPIRSSFNPYDPMLDYNHDGKISLADLVQFAASYGTTGDPTINVNVTNWPQTYSLQTGTLNFTSNGWTNPLISCGGYSRLSILLLPRNTNIGAGSNVTISLGSIMWLESPSPLSCISSDFSISGFNVTIFSTGSWGGLSSYMTETKAPYCYLEFFQIGGGNLPSNWYVTVDYAVYLRNE